MTYEMCLNREYHGKYLTKVWIDCLVCSLQLMLSPQHAQSTAPDILELLHPQCIDEHGAWLSQERLIIFIYSGVAILTLANTILSINVFFGSSSLLQPYTRVDLEQNCLENEMSENV